MVTDQIAMLEDMTSKLMSGSTPEVLVSARTLALEVERRIAALRLAYVELVADQDEADVAASIKRRIEQLEQGLDRMLKAVKPYWKAAAAGKAS
jgi:hypothetical protein